jgi:PPOX class probable F420-dependent enzyme
MTSQDIGNETYANLSTFRKTGKEVWTPVWLAPDGDRIVVYTNATSGKVKRIRNGGRVRLAPCDVRGRLRGDWVDGQARMLEEPAELDRALAAVVRKYGWQMKLALLASRLSGRYKDRAAIEIRISSAPSRSAVS